MTLCGRNSIFTWYITDHISGKNWVFLFARMSNRIISVYDSRNLSEALSTLESTVSPSTLIPFYDEDSAVLFFFSKV